jgi:hypothetical protein
MKRKVCGLNALLLSAFVILLCGMASAQIGGEVLKFKIPFEFNVGKQTFPAGDYSLKPLLPNTMQLRNGTGQVVTNIAANTVESSETANSVKLVFNGYGEKYFLAQIWHAGDNRGLEVIKSLMEVELAKKHSAPQQVALLVIGNADRPVRLGP